MIGAQVKRNIQNFVIAYEIPFVGGIIVAYDLDNVDNVELQARKHLTAQDYYEGTASAFAGVVLSRAVSSGLLNAAADYCIEKIRGKKKQKIVKS